MHTNETPNLKLSQFVATDKPTWLGDYNDDMAKIDSSIGAADAAAESAQAAANSAATSAAKAVSDVASLTVKVSGYDQSIANASSTAAEALTKAQKAEGDAATATSTANSVSGTAQQALTAAQQANNTANQASTTASGLSSQVQQAQTTANSASSAATAAQNRADQAYDLAQQAISGGGGGGGGTPDVNSVGTAQIQDGAVTTSKLASSVQSSITSAQNAAEQANTTASTANSTADAANTTASQALAATQQTATRGSIDSAPVGSGHVSVVYEIHPLTKLVVLKFWYDNASFSGAAPVSVGTIPSQYRPASQWTVNAGRVGEQNISSTVNSNGTVQVLATGAVSGVSLTNIIVYYAGL